ncbi:DUF1178 family protein [Rhodoligotrophos defluvii]|uniref:DUF1178 family protein n=1 Tax=Rhodoligotrophos defluvii TaxID=2561934 RepID=UPI0010C937CE|nr:DUF1178 family protein [Rhodoligotrophos defluvii]
MIRYDLVCGEGHEFDGWFANSETFEKQAAAKLIDCPHCGDTAVSKAIMAPRINRAGEAEKGKQAEPPTAPPEMAELITLLRRIKRHVLENAENVGERFAEEARKIHYDEAERRSIYGEASAEDARALLEEGIEIHALPVLPEEAN